MVAELLVECRTALDVGAGFGALALPLARRLLRVTAIEPAAAIAPPPGVGAIARLTVAQVPQQGTPS